MSKKKYPIPATIVIRLNGDETTATIMGDEKVQSVRAATAEDLVEKASQKTPEFQIGDIVRVTNAGIAFGLYKNGDIAVVTKVVSPSAVWFRTAYDIKVRSKERKGSEGVAFAEELTLLHRPAKEGEKR